jgi:hypothetical protein
MGKFVSRTVHQHASDSDVDVKTRRFDMSRTRAEIEPTRAAFERRAQKLYGPEFVVRAHIMNGEWRFDKFDPDKVVHAYLPWDHDLFDAAQLDTSCSFRLTETEMDQELREVEHSQA